MSEKSLNHTQPNENTVSQTSLDSRPRRRRALPPIIARERAAAKIEEFGAYLDRQCNVTFVIAATNQVNFGPSIGVAIELFTKVMYARHVAGGCLLEHAPEQPDVDMNECHRTQRDIEARIEELAQNAYSAFAVFWHVEGDPLVHVHNSMNGERECVLEIAGFLADWMLHELLEAAHCAPVVPNSRN